MDPSLRADEDTDGHGTHILTSLLRYAPFADLYVLRLSNSGGEAYADNAATVGQIVDTRDSMY